MNDVERLKAEVERLILKAAPFAEMYFAEIDAKGRESGLGEGPMIMAIAMMAASIYTVKCLFDNEEHAKQFIRLLYDIFGEMPLP